MNRFSAESIPDFLVENRWLDSVDSVEFLAAGEYNENYRVYSGDSSFVFRINHGSQIGQKEQIVYEYKVLEAVCRSQRTPRPLMVLPLSI